MKELIIDRSKWLCGHELALHCELNSMLSNSKGMMCCLGFLGATVGGTQESMLEVFTPDTCPHVNWPAGVITNDKDSAWTSVAIRVNDSRSLGDVDREGILADHFRGIGYRLLFTGSYTNNEYNNWTKD